jgi:hypothetical protein
LKRVETRRVSTVADYPSLRDFHRNPNYELNLKTYKGYPVYVFSVPAQSAGWYPRGIVLDAEAKAQPSFSG